MKSLLVITLFICSLTFGQTVHKSLMTEYIYKSGNDSPYEWIDRDIYITTDTVTIISNGKLITDIQKWKINHWEKNIDTRSTNYIYYTSLVNSRKGNDIPAIFRVYENEAGQVELIEWAIPPPEDALNTSPVVARFYIDF